jgi:AraC-like DNA-binding protein
MTAVFETTDPEAARDLLGKLYGVRRFASVADPVRLRVEQDRFGPFALARTAFSVLCTVEGDPLGAVYVSHQLAGSVTNHEGRENRVWAPGDIYLGSLPERPFRITIDAADTETMAFDPGLLARLADGPVRFTGYRPASGPDATLLRETYAYVRTTFAGRTDLPPLMLASAARLLAATALAVFPNTAGRDPTIEDRHDAHPAALRRAVAYIDANAHRDIAAADIADAAHVTIRAVQLAFRRHLGTTPLAYVRRLRLELAHRELVAADPESTTVTAVANRWGFGNHSRFTVRYRAAFGTTPSRTLRKR